MDAPEVSPVKDKTEMIVFGQEEGLKDKLQNQPTISLMCQE